MDLLEFRTAIGLTLESVGEAVGAAKSTIWKIEQGELIPRGDLLLRISDWAEAERKRRHLPVKYRLSWDYLNARRDESAGAN